MTSSFLPAAQKELLPLLKQQTVGKCSDYYEALVGGDHLPQADALRDKLLDFDGSVGTYVSLVHHAIRAGNPKAARSLVDSAKTKLSAAEARQVAQAAK